MKKPGGILNEKTKPREHELNNFRYNACAYFFLSKLRVSSLHVLNTTTTKWQKYKDINKCQSLFSPASV